MCIYQRVTAYTAMSVLVVCALVLAGTHLRSGKDQAAESKPAGQVELLILP